MTPDGATVKCPGFEVPVVGMSDDDHTELDKRHDLIT